MALKLEKAFKRWLFGMRKMVVIGLGNRLRGDDAIGLEFINTLKGRVGENILLIEAETTPENYTDVISDFKPTHILFVDAAQFNKQPGFVKLVSISKVAALPISTHSIPFDILARYLARSVSAKIALLGIQPKCVDFKEGLSKEAKEAVKEAAELLVRMLEGEGLTS